MSNDTVDLYNEKKKELIEQGSNSQEAILDGATTIFGIFDESFTTGSNDSGNVPQRIKKPRFLVDTIPAFTPTLTTLEINSVTYIINNASGKDKNGYSILWLV